MFAVIRGYAVYDFLWSCWPITWKTSERCWRDRITELEGEKTDLDATAIRLGRHVDELKTRHASDVKLVNELNQKLTLSSQKLAGSDQGNLNLQRQLHEMEQRCSRLAQVLRQIHTNAAPKIAEFN